MRRPLAERIHARAHHRGRYGHEHIARNRTYALILIYTALLRVGVWTVLTILYLIGVAFAVALFKSVAFVALISMFALILTDWGQFAASMAQLTAGDVHHAVSVASEEAGKDVAALEADIAQLARVEPGPEGDQLADMICRRLRG